MSGEGQSKSVLGPDNPWPGLNQFFEDHDRYFRGRDEEKAELFRLVKGETLTILFGKSGLGKSSLLQAGLFPLLRQAGYLPVFIHIRYDDPATDDRDSLPPLASQVYAALREACDAGKVEAPEIREEETLWEYFHRAEAAFWNERNRLVTPVLVFDQFEEAFTLGVEDERRRKQRDAFLTQLEELAENRPPQTLRERWDKDPELVSEFEQDRTPCKIILALREDFLPDLEQLKEKIRSILHNRFRLERMDGGKAWQVVTGETIVDGEPRRALSHLVDEDVALKIIDFVSKTRGQRGEDPLTRETLRARTVDPALLSVVCSELNNRRLATQPPQDKISFTLLSESKEEIIRKFFDSHVNALGAGAEPVRRFIEEDLITGSGFRKRCAMEDALRQQGVTRDDLRRLEQQRILRFEPSEGITWIELTHDLLTEVVYASRLRRREREERAKVEAVAAAKRRKKKTYLAIAAVLLLIAAGYPVMSWRITVEGTLRKDAEEARRKADEARGEAEEARRNAEWSWQQAEKYFVQYIAEKIAHQLSERPPNIASAHLFARGAWDSGIANYPYHDYADAISMFGEAPLFAPKTILPLDKPIRQIAYSTDGRLGVLDDGGNFRILDLNVTQDLKPLDSTSPRQGGVAAFSFHPGGKPIVALRRADEESATLLNYERNEQIVLPLNTSSPTAETWESASPTSGKSSPTTAPKLGIAFSPYSSEGDLLAIAVRDGTVRIFNLDNLTPDEGTKGVKVAEVASTCVRDENATGASTRVRPPSGSEDETRRSDAVLPTIDEPATELAFIRIGPVPQLVTANTNGVWVWPHDPDDPAEQGPVGDFRGDLTHERLVNRRSARDGIKISLSGVGTAALGQVLCIAPYDVPDGASLFTEDERSRAAWLNLIPRDLLISLSPLRAQATATACAPDGQFVAVGVESGDVYIFRGGEMLQRLDREGSISSVASRPGANSESSPPIAVRSIAFRPDGKALAFASGDGKVRVWQLSSYGRLAMASRPVFARIVALSPDGRWLASAESDRIRLREAATRQLERDYKGSDEPIALAVNNRGDVFAVAGDANKIARWDFVNGGKSQVWQGREIIALSPDAKWAVCTNATGALEMVADTGESKAIALRQTAPTASGGVISAENVSEKGVVAISPSGGLTAAYDASENKITLCANPWLPRTEDGVTLASHTNPWTWMRKISAYANPWLPRGGGADSFPYHMPNPWNLWQWRFREPTMRVKSKIECKQELKHLAFAPSERLLFATTENDLLVFDVEMGRQIFQRAAGGWLTALSTGGSKAGSTLALALEYQPLRVWGSAHQGADATSGGMSPPDPAELEKKKIAELEKIAGVTFKDFDLIPRSETEPETHTAVPMDTAAAAFWAAFWETGRRVAALTRQRSADDLANAYAPVREALERGEPTHCWQAAVMRQRLEVMPPWASADAAALRARLGAMDGLEAPERVILLRDGILPFAKGDATIFALLAIEQMIKNEEGVQELTELLAAGNKDVDEILRTWPIDSDVRYVDIVEKELIPHVPVDRKADRAQLFVVLAKAYAEAWSRVPKTETVSMAQKDLGTANLDHAFTALEKAVEFGFNNWAAELPRLAKLIDDPRFKPEWLPPSDIIIQTAESSLDHEDAETALRLLRRALDQEPTNFQANLYYGHALRMAGSASWDNAVTALDRAAELAGSPADKARVQVERGMLWRDSGESEKALGAFDAALKEDPNNRAAKKMRRIVVKELGSANQ